MSSVKIPRAFVLVTLIWGVIGLGISIFFADSQPIVHVSKWFLALWVMSTLDLLSLAKFIASLIQQSLLQALFWGAAKFGFLGILILTLATAERIPSASLLAGLGGLIVIPLCGGFLWSKKELQS